jgi:protein-tyrosine phosphatase
LSGPPAGPIAIDIMKAFASVGSTLIPLPVRSFPVRSRGIDLKPQIYWIDGPWPGRLGILPRPRGGDWLDDEMQAWKNAGVDVVVSLLMPDEVMEFDLGKEGESCKNHGSEFLSFGIPDRSVPASRRETSELLKRIDGYLATGRGVAIHCRQGIGRSGLMAACLLILWGTKPSDAVTQISRQRGCETPETAEQRNWLVDFATADLPALRQAVAQQHATAERAGHSGTP